MAVGGGDKDVAAFTDLAPRRARSRPTSIISLIHSGSESSSHIDISPSRDFTLSDLQRLRAPTHFDLDVCGGLNSSNLCPGPARSQLLS